MKVYLDNAATTKCSSRAAKQMIRLLEEDYGNPSSMHAKGVEAEQYIKEAKETLHVATEQICI